MGFVFQRKRRVDICGVKLGIGWLVQSAKRCVQFVSRMNSTARRHDCEER
jgi:hypothetical protein